MLGADRDRPGGFEGPYEKDVAFHEPFTTFAFIAAVTKKLDMITTVMILPQRQTVLVAKQAAELAILSNNRFKLGIGVGWNAVEYTGLNENFKNRGKRQEEQVELMRLLWESEVLEYKGDYHHIDKASINPRPSKSVPIWFGGGAPQLIERCADLGDGWIPLMGPNEAARKTLAAMKAKRESKGLDWDNFGVQAQAQYAGGDAERWNKHAEKWRNLGASHLAIATHNAEPTNVDGHLRRIKEYLNAVT